MTDMCTITLSYDKENAKARDMLASMLASGLFFAGEDAGGKDHLYLEDGEVKMDISEGATDLEDFRSFLHEMVDLEYSLA
ncbi:MAG: hypothetical protein IJS59_00540 [Bacteroidaceae bacterium]|nr:hypothetical protein [Bacteroidaceae bacterium]